MIFLKRFFEYSIFISALLLAFLLAFESYLQVPHLVSWLGHWHPLILHFPIVLIFVTIIQYWRKDEYVEWYLSVTTLATLLTAITGFLLSVESGSKGNTIIIHQWLGAGVAYLTALWYWISSGKLKSRKIYLPLQSGLIILIVTTGHFGGMVTHGEDFLSWKKSKSASMSALPDDPNIYQFFVQPILDQKCKSCHNENKAKGQLVLSNYSSMVAGGASGETINRSNLQESTLLQRIMLPIGHDDHMPPKDEQQLTDIETTILQDWIMAGASDQMQFSNLEKGSEIHPLIAKRIAAVGELRWNNLPDISEDQMEELRSDYITISRIFSQSNALQVIVFPNNEFVAGDLKVLKPITANIVELNLSGLQLNQKDVQLVNSMQNLEKLNLNHSSIDDGLFNAFGELSGLKELMISKTTLTEAALGKIADFPVLQKLFAYQTNISQETLQRYGEKHRIFVIGTPPEAETFKSVLPAPSLRNTKSFFSKPFKLALWHPLKEIDIFYSLSVDHGTSTFQKFNDSILIDTNARLEYYAEKAGWESSPVDSVHFFRASVFPDQYELAYSPNAKYPGRGAALLFDLQKGPDNFGDSAWMAFREEPFVLNCSWNQEIRLNSITISTMIQTDPYLFPPQSIIVRGGPGKNSMKVLGRIYPEKMNERRERSYDFFTIAVAPATIKYLQIEVFPLQSLPVWHQGKGQKGWVFIDEVALDGQVLP
jgi:hypothetical protein